jgi:type II secretory pathway component PulF
MSFALKYARFLFNTLDSTRMDFYQDFADALSDGASDIDHLKKLAMRARLRGGWREALYQFWLSRMRRMTFAQSLQNTVPQHESMVLCAAEENGKLPEAMRFLARSLKTASQIKAAYFMSLISPVLGAATILVFMVVHALVISPILVQVVPLARWPLLSSVLYHASTGLVNYWPIILLILVGVFVALRWSKAHWCGPARDRIEHIPGLPWKGYRRNQSINFLVTLAILLRSNGLGMKESLQRMRALANPWQARQISRMLQRLTHTPDVPAKALDTGFFDPELMDRIEDYSERSDFFVALSTLAFDQSERFVRQAERHAILAGFMALMCVAGTLVFFVLANYEMNQAMESAFNIIK